MHASSRLSLLTFLLLLGAVSIGLTATRSVAQKSPVASSAGTESSLLPSAPRAGVTTQGRRARKNVVASVVTTPKKPAVEIRPVLNQSDIELRHQRIAEEVLRLFPSHCQDTLKSFYVRYDNPKQRGLAGKTTVIVSGNVPDDEFRALLAHEFGHMIDLGCLQGSPQGGESPFRDGKEIIYLNDASVRFYSLSWTDSKTKRNDARSSDFVSGYAQWDPFEDLSETVAAYVLHREALMALAAKNAVIAAKVRWIETELFPAAPTVASSSFEWGQKHPWDITKLPYKWQASLNW